MSEVSELLLAWYDHSKRHLPWRDVHDPYATWVSEIMLQQTRVQTVIPYFQRFMADFPDVMALAGADEQDVLKHWEGLGYYSRARNLLCGARQVAEEYNGVVPSNVAELRKIKGIGDYTAGAIASIAYGCPVPAVDGNAIRVVCRLFDIQENTGIPSVKRKLSETIEKLIPPDRPGDFNQAIMDLGSRICVPGTPRCDICPLQDLCRAYQDGNPEDLPVLPAKTAVKTQQYDVILVVSNGKTAMRCRKEKMLQGLWIYPMLEGENTEQQITEFVIHEFGMKAESLMYTTRARHVFTHRVWEMKIWLVRVEGNVIDNRKWRWIDRQEMEMLTIPTAVKAAREVVLQAFDAAGTN